MPIINFMEPFTLLIGVVLFILVTYLSKKTKKSWISAIMLFVFIAVLVSYVIQFMMLDVNAPNIKEIELTIIRSTGVTLVFVLLSFFIYLWVDDTEAKMGKRKSIDNSLEWFWKKV